MKDRWPTLIRCLAAVFLCSHAELRGSERLAWTTSQFVGTPDTPPPFTVERVYPDAKFVNPVAMVHSADWNQFFVLDLTGKLFAFDESGTGQTDLVVDLAEAIPGVQRAYGIAFDPDYATNRYVYLCYIYRNKDPKGTAVARFRMPAGPSPKLDLDSRLEMIHWLSGGHNGGCLKFGPDGYLYISTGDAEAPSPPDRLQTGQDVSDLLAGILRIDVQHSSAEEPYQIPPDNPFVSLAGARPEIWAYGMRNPWRMSFDRETGELWVGDVGWELWEMIYRVERGGNYGWSVVEGRQPVNQQGKRGPTPILLPMAEHPHSEARSITGGYVYRGTRLPSLNSKYLYGDYVTGKMWALPSDATPLDPPEEVANTNVQIICFGEGPDGEVYPVDYVAGTIHRLIENPARSHPSKFPKTLSESGLFKDTTNHQLVSGVLSYDIAAELWEDDAGAQRFIAIPEKEKLGRYNRNRFQQGEIKDAWAFPEGSVLGKTLSLETGEHQERRVETQILHRLNNRWNAYSYLWREDQSDADLVEAEGRNLEIERIDGLPSKQHHIASRTECILCHTIQAGGILGFTKEQLAGTPSAAHRDELAHFASKEFFKQQPVRNKTAFVNPYDESADLHLRARSYLHVNCAHCHRFGGGGTAIFDLRFELSDEATKLFSAPPIQGTFGIQGGQVIAPQDPSASLLYYRMAKLGPGRMPHFGAEAVDVNGLRMLQDWINAMPIPANASQGSVAELREQQHNLLANYQRSNDPTASNATNALVRLLETPSGGIQLLQQLDPDRPRFPAQHRKIAIKAGAQHDDSRIRDLFIRFIAEDERKPRIGLSTDPNPILSLKGDPDQGRHILKQDIGLRCFDCHQIEGQGKAFGPNLDGIGERLTREAILESLLAPSTQIAPEFSAETIETVAGDIYTGFVSNDSETALLFRDLAQGDVTIKRSEIETRDRSTLSLMPQYLLQNRSPQDVADLLAYLVSLN